MQFFKSLIIILTILPQIGFAQKSIQQDKVLTPKELKDFNQAKKEARLAHSQKDYQKAVQFFHQTLAIDPNHVQMLSEMAFSLYYLKDYALSESYSLKALSRSIMPKQKASILYNLGMTYEAQGLKDKAAQYYVDSLKLRMHPSVRAKLEAIDPSRLKEIDQMLFVSPLKGPYQNIKDFCRELHGTKKEHIDLCDTNGMTPVIPKKPSPYQGVYLISTPTIGTEMMMGVEMSYYFVIQTSAGFFVNMNHIDLYNPGAFGINQELNIDHVKQDDFLKNNHAPELKISYQIASSDADLAGAIVTSDQYSEMIFCGIGPSMIPSCTKAINYASEHEIAIDASAIEDAKSLGIKAEPHQSWDFIFEYTDNGIEIKQGKFTQMKSFPSDKRNEIGKKEIIFP